ncbi:MAG: NifB/NifX family molybdenum-iron cluster-binding protein [Deltaproteobacteria bacterium]|nr:NifB/NifX family molybdenum-iron cluster-binding protein [Deltaproteobacteria bacterium]MBW2307998.1 NifB/NifX family molybdenum-iron cluster-binding protein [Deltaproteobacteria bacterium]
MKIALSVWEGRISPVFDTSRQLLVVDVEDGKPAFRSRERFRDEPPWRKIARLLEMDIEVLMCGAISRPLADRVSASGIRLIPFVAGNVEEVIDAYLSGALPGPRFLMPGFCRKGRRFRGGRFGGMGKW